MNPMQTKLAGGAVALVLVAGAGGYGLARLSSKTSAPMPAQAAPASTAVERPVLYWYDPMVPAQRFAKPGKSPFMDMQLVPKYAEEAGQGGVRVDPAAAQNLGLRTATATAGVLAAGFDATGVVDFNQREVAVVQARANGFVQRVYGRAPGDVVKAGAPLADLLIPAWAGAQGEYLAVRAASDPALAAAARQRLVLLGMQPALIAEIERSDRVRPTVTVTTPRGGVIQTLDVREGMTVASGQTLAEVRGLSSVWLNASVPEVQAGSVRVGQAAAAEFSAFPGERFGGRVTAILPQANADSRTLQVRIELANAGGRLRPGMFASVHLGAAGARTLLVSSEAVIRTGRRTLVMLAQDGGRYTAAEVRTGRESGGQIEILAGLAEGERIVTSGQFLLDSEASLSGKPVRGLDAARNGGAAE